MASWLASSLTDPSPWRGENKSVGQLSPALETHIIANHTLLSSPTTSSGTLTGDPSEEDACAARLSPTIGSATESTVFLLSASSSAAGARSTSSCDKTVEAT